METDRSRILSYQQCPRQRYLAYHHLGTGIQRTRKSLPLQFGSAFHIGVEQLLMGNSIEQSVGWATTWLQQEFNSSRIAFDGELPDDAQKALDYGREEQMALAEGSLRAWWAYEGESFLANFEVIEVEREGRADLINERSHCEYFDEDDDKGIHATDADPLTLMFRPDALVRDRASGDLYVVSWKTCATWGKRNVDQARHDMQSMSEVWGAESEQEGRKIEGVLYKWIVKGFRKKDEWDGLYKQNTPLIYGWQKLNAAEDDVQWSWSWKWSDPEEINPKTGKVVGHTLGKGWKLVPIWRDFPGGVKAWVEGLAKGEIFPRFGDPLAELFPQAMPVERRADEVESWKEQIIEQELRVDANVAALSQGKITLNQAFPQHTHSCHSYSGCLFIDVCWNGAPAEPGELYSIRSANHPEKWEGE